MTVALRGNLKDFGIGEVFQLIGQQRKTGILEFSNRGQRVQLRFDRGAVVSAAPVGSRPETALGEMLARCGRLPLEQVEELQRECRASAQTLGRLAVATGQLTESELVEIEDLLTRDTIFRVLRWSSGSFDFTAQEVEHHRNFDSLLGAEQILMDGMRMVDEWQSFADQVPSEDAIFHRVGRFDAYRQKARGEQVHRLDAAERVFNLIDGRLAVRRIVDLSLLGSFDATRILAELRRAGLIEPLDPERARSVRQRPAPLAPGRSPVWGWIRALAPLTLLLLLAVLANRVEPAEVGERAFSIHRAPLESVRQSFAERRVRNALESYRFIEGRWPRLLLQLEERGLLANDALASSAGRPYYYVQREDGAVLLAPER
jgi:hypothetical protein